MENAYHVVNDYLVKVFNSILDIEESSLKGSEFSDLSIKEMHTVEAIGLKGHYTSTEVANKLNITVGTLTVAVNNLVRKGYVYRVRPETDRRIVRLGLTKKGRLLYRIHDKFHKDMVKRTLNDMDANETAVLMKGLQNLYAFLMEQKEKQQKITKES